MPPRKPRISLTRAQVQAGAGAELLALCQTVTADGKLTDAEVDELRAWLGANRDHDLPAIGFLVATLERILADGRVTRDERKELYAAIEKVLPPEVRAGAVSNRKLVEAEERDAERRGREEQKQLELAARERGRPVYSVNFMVAGVPYEGRDAVVRRFVAEGDTVFLARDPGNAFSCNAIEVRLGNGMQIGFVPEDYAPEAAPFLDGGCPHKASVVKIIGYRYSIPVVRAYLYRTDSDEPDLVFPRDVPEKPAPAREPRGTAWDGLGDARPRARGKGCLLALACLLAGAAGACGRFWS